MSRLVCQRAGRRCYLENGVTLNLSTGLQFVFLPRTQTAVNLEIELGEIYRLDYHNFLLLYLHWVLFLLPLFRWFARGICRHLFNILAWSLATRTDSTLSSPTLHDLTRFFRASFAEMISLIQICARSCFFKIDQSARGLLTSLTNLTTATAGHTFTNLRTISKLSSQTEQTESCGLGIRRRLFVGECYESLFHVHL